MQTVSRPPTSRRPAMFRFSAAMYLDLIDAGFFGDSAHVELIDGVILTMPAQEMDHATCVSQTTELFQESLRRRARVWTQMPVRAFGDNLPEPDIALVVRRKYTKGHPPGADDIFLVVEVADTSLRVDRTIKAKLYATSLFREYWLVELRLRRLVVHRDPVDGVYQDIQTYGPDDAVRVLAFPDITPTIADLLP